MNTSYLGGEWYIDEMKTRANDAPGVPFSLPKSKYTHTNDYIPVLNAIDRPVDIREVIDFVRSEDPRSKTALSDGTPTDYIPCKRIALPVNKENAIASGIVAEKDRDQMVDTVYINLKKNALAKNELMLLDTLANFDWKRPIYLTQVYILQNFGLMDYLQFDGYAYRFVPILTPVRNAYEIGRIDPDYAARCCATSSATATSRTRTSTATTSSSTTSRPRTPGKPSPAWPRSCCGRTAWRRA